MGCVLGLCTSGRKGESPKEEGGGGWKGKLEGVRKEGCGQKKTGGWCLLLRSCEMEITTSSRRKLSVVSSLANFSCGFEESWWNLSQGVKVRQCVSVSVSQSVSQEQTSCQEHRRPSCLIPKSFSYQMFSKVTFHILGCVGYQHE